MIILASIRQRHIHQQQEKSMSLVKYGGGVAAISGKTGGTVYARNKAGAYSRNWAKPINPGRSRQTDVRSSFAAASAAYAQLTLTNVKAWASYAALVTRLNRQGDSYTPSGRQMFMECYNNAISIGASPLSTPSSITNVPAIISLGVMVLTVTTGHINLMSLASSVVSVPSGGDGVTLIEAAPFHKVSVTNVNTAFRQIFSAPSIDGPFNIKAGYVAVFGDVLQVNQIGDLRVRVVDEISFLGSTKMLLSKQAA